MRQPNSASVYSSTIGASTVVQDGSGNTAEVSPDSKGRISVMTTNDAPEIYSLPTCNENHHDEHGPPLSVASRHVSRDFDMSTIAQPEVEVETRFRTLEDRLRELHHANIELTERLGRMSRVREDHSDTSDAPPVYTPTTV